ncbi:hypothetical protein GPECTOR_12g425 [Gonium pectorale]|uniref:Uncharacterized protein n=1 Tax=Gonium pectorale TaxID=33097 RepID=A0A150GNZ3_GONPE|nr:hypothetical protein GPECTOR_12g425 [Gonium pectorale]|eukprot:KXZ51462.1 hypothetical protein GPECTOR_12g425 [Gonium pectorale]
MNTTKRRSTTISCVNCEPETFEKGICRGAAIKYNDSRALRLRRRALLQWEADSPSKVLIIKKPKNPAASAKLQEIGTWLKARGIQVFVERVVWATEFKEFEVFDPHVNRDAIDFCITLGGDGTVLYMTSLFEEDEPLPPTLCFAMGSLGFLTPFDASAALATLERVLDTSAEPLFCTLRTRKRCEVVYDGQLEAVHHVLNECVVDRGAFPGAVLLEIFADGSYVTNVEADGLIISTPSGSTAYSMSAGGPIVAPSVPCTVITPMAPLSLSFRPLVIPESSSLCVHLPTCARAHARASFDGRRPMRIRRGTSIFFTASLCPLPVISLGRMDTDWYEGITSKLKWNQAIRQLPSCPSPVGARQQELRSLGGGERRASTLCAMLDSAAEGCPVSSYPPGAPAEPPPMPPRPKAAAEVPRAPALDVGAPAAAAAAGASGAGAVAVAAAHEAPRGRISRASGAFGSLEDCGSAGSCSNSGSEVPPCRDGTGEASRESLESLNGSNPAGSSADEPAAAPATPRPAAAAAAVAAAVPAPGDGDPLTQGLELEAESLIMERANSLAKAAEAAEAASVANARAHADAALRRPIDGAHQVENAVSVTRSRLVL